MTRALPLLALALALAACEVPLDPIEPSDAVFSVSGYLDATADTQWVRVEPLARSVGTDPGPLEAVVTLTGPDGAARPLAQEVRDMATGPAHLFWTTADVAPGATYRLEARRTDGASTRTAVEVPTEAFRVEVEDGPYACPTVVTVTGAERVVDVQTRYVVAVGARASRHRVSHVEAIAPGPDGTVRLPIYSANDLDLLPPGPGAEVVHSEILVAAGTDAWPPAAGLTLEDRVGYNDPGVEGGVGFVGGVVTRAEPYVRPLSPCRGRAR